MRIQTLHPDPSTSTPTIDREKYDAISVAIFAVLDDQGPLSFTEMTEEVAELLGTSFEGSIPWYVTVLKADLEARGTIRVDRSGKRQLIDRG